MQGVPGIDRAQFALTAIWLRAHPDNVNQESWTTVTNPEITILDGTEVGDGCGTTGCQAGTNVFANGMRLLYDKDQLHLSESTERTFEWAVPRGTKLLFDEDLKVMYPEGVVPAKIYNLAAQNLYGLNFDDELNPSFEYESFERRLYLACREHFQGTWAHLTYRDQGVAGVADILDQVVLSPDDDTAIDIIMDHTDIRETYRYREENDTDDSTDDEDE